MTDWSTFNNSMLEWTKEFERQAKRYIDELVAEKVKEELDKRLGKKEQEILTHND